MKVYNHWTWKGASTSRILKSQQGKIWRVCMGVKNVVRVVGGMCEKEELVEFVWVCVAYEHNDVCKQKEHGKRLGVKSRN
jgi:hypothetical protein